ncbi:hypothetical protein [Actinomadura oligospora]|uniref:hypothetical protein n=1 Tax=Actinomadura oligospora TaxID=111804 RepID=UPI00047A8D1C|nr:hypothetical protein [Actinomadura oligospora]
MTTHPHTPAATHSATAGAARSDHAERLWLRGTWTRTSLRYARALHELSKVPTALALGQFAPLPDSQDAKDAAEAIEKAVQAAYSELDRILTYLNAVLDPGAATCQVCGAALVPDGGTPITWQHWRRHDGAPMAWAPYAADHVPAITFSPPTRPDWAKGDADLNTQPASTHTNHGETA